MRMHRRRHARRPRGAAWLALCALLLGCVTTGPIVPYPEVVQAPNPLRLPPAAAQEDLLERYSASPNRNPDGLGVLESIWLNSRMTLISWPLAEGREEVNRLAYARSAAEQAQVLAEARQLYGEHWVFEGVLLGDVDAAVSVDFYLPEGIYLVDDRGRKYLPEVARDADPLAKPRVVSRFGEARTGFPRLIFPKAAITEQTRAVSLYFAAFNKRLRFTWVFDADYDLPAAGPGLHSGREANRLFPSR